MSTATIGVCLDYQAVAKKAIRPLRAKGVTAYMEAEELLSIGMLAAIQHGTQDEGLAVKVARDAMIDASRRNERANRGRVEIRDGCAGPDGEDISDGDQWDEAIHGKQNLCPANTHPDLWEAMKALSPRQYQAITLKFWGNLTDAAIGEEMGISGRAVGRLIERSIKNINGCVQFPDSRTVTNMRGNESLRVGPFGLVRQA